MNVTSMRLGTSLCLLLLLAAGGCARSVHAPARPVPTLLGASSPFLVPTLAPGDAWLRHHLILGEPLNALARFESPSERPTSDDLLRALQQAIVHREAGELERSNELLEWADRESEKRRVRSATRTAASFLISDRVLSYTPTTTETAMIPYYRMMNYLDLGENDEAAVEARRISAILGSGKAADVRRCRGDGMLYYLSSLVFEGAGEANDALVSIRRAEGDFAACRAEDGVTAPAGFGRDLHRMATSAGLAELADSAVASYPGADWPIPSDSAEVVVVVERGFIAHRAEQALHVPVRDDELDGLDSGNDAGIERVAAEVAARLSGNLIERERWGRSWDDHPDNQLVSAFRGAYVLRLVWPAVMDGMPLTGSPVTSIGGRQADFARVADLSALAHAEFEAERAAILTRLVARGVTKYLVSREVEKKAEKEGGELLGFLAGRLMNLAANETERADTRSWTLLPQEISIARVTVAPGEVPIGAAAANASSTPEADGGTRRVTVRAGERRVVALRVYPFDEAPDAEAVEAAEEGMSEAEETPRAPLVTPAGAGIENGLSAPPVIPAEAGIENGI